ncbi:hypothetical protein A2U01_0067641, partial [Trifolium medium]|nr:hypothetical protein [Trifolium medium]
MYLPEASLACQPINATICKYSRFTNGLREGQVLDPPPRIRTQ